MTESPMPLHPSSFDLYDIEQWGMGAGVIPMSFDSDGNLRFLLGRERYVNQWKGSCRWSGFEGSRKEHETLRSAALREFQEESMDVVVSLSDLQRCIHDGDYYIRIVLKITNDRKPERYHATYVVLIDWDAQLPERFQAARAHVEYVERLLQEWRHTRPTFLGETGEEVGPIQDNGDGTYTVWKYARHSPCILQSPWVYDSLNDSCVMAHISDERCGVLLAWSNVRERLERAIRVKHRAIRFTRDRTWGFIQDVSIVRDYLEKDQVRWWNLAQLRQILHGRGCNGMDRFRPYFLPVLQTLLSEIDETPPHVADLRSLRLVPSLQEQQTGNGYYDAREKGDDKEEPTGNSNDSNETFDRLLCGPCQDHS